MNLEFRRVLFRSETGFCHVGQAGLELQISGDTPASGVKDQPGQYGEIPSLIKIKKLAGRGGTCL